MPTDKERRTNILKRALRLWCDQGTRAVTSAALRLLADRVLSPKADVPTSPRSIYTRNHLTGSHFDIGEYSYGVPTVLFPGGRLKIGRFCSISGDVVIFLGGDHAMAAASTYPFYTPFPPDNPPADEHAGIGSFGDVTIGNDVWIGYGATIMADVTIGDGAVIGARAVVASDIPAYAIAVGNPARVVKYRFDEPMRGALLALHWWDWPTEKIRANREALMGEPGRLLSLRED